MIIFENSKPPYIAFGREGVSAERSSLVCKIVVETISKTPLARYGRYEFRFTEGDDLRPRNEIDYPEVEHELATIHAVFDKKKSTTSS